MKAWEVKNKYEGFNAEIVFATTAGKAKTLALSISEDNFDDSNFCDLEAHRAPALDKYYKQGKTHTWIGVNQMTGLCLLRNMITTVVMIVLA